MKQIQREKRKREPSSFHYEEEEEGETAESFFKVGTPLGSAFGSEKNLTDKKLRKKFFE